MIETMKMSSTIEPSTDTQLHFLSYRAFIISVPFFVKPSF